MARHIRWCYSLVKMCLIFGISSTICIRTSIADCFYDDQVYEEGVEVETFEHCLNCTCTRGVLLCYLRVCPNLPNPPPVGCILLHRYRTCCPELICSDFTGDENALESRSDPEGLDLLPFEDDGEADACISNGSIYAPGSAMDSSSHCEYCYCLRGRQTCVTPKCLLPIDGCIPSYEPNQCCPVQYNCSISTKPSTTTTTMVPELSHKAGGCLVENEFYEEGDKVLGVGHSACDNCYCLRGMLRCEPLSCAPPLLGCQPIIKPGDCCAASYNCTGSIQIDAEPNYGHYPIVSSEYSKLRKEQPKKPHVHNNRRTKPEIKQPSGPFYVIAETSKSDMNSHRNLGTAGTTRQFTGLLFNPSTTTPFYYKSMLRESDDITSFKHVTRSYPESKFRTSTLNNDEENHELAINIDYKGKSTTLNLLDSILTVSEDMTETTTNTFSTEENTSFNENILETVSTIEPTVTTMSENIDSSTTNNEDSSTETSTLVEKNTSETITIRSVSNTTDCVKSEDFDPKTAEAINNLVETNQFTPLAEASSSESPDVTEIDLHSSFNLTDNVSPKVKNGTTITSLVNASKTKENEYDMDYNDPSLPPSLPNLHIIPFLAADALDSKKDNENSLLAQDKSSNDTFEFTSLFSPPVKTEGGFVPNSNPVILETLYDNAVTVATPTGSSENPAKCTSSGKDVLHGQSVPSDSPCMTCACFYGNIVCQKIPCPLPGPNCRKSIDDSNLCCPIYDCDVNRDVESDSKSVLQPTEKLTMNRDTTTDPFKDVIKTEPAPDLQSLMVDYLPHLAKKENKKTTIYITTFPPVTEQQFEKTTERKDDTLSIDKVLELLLGGLGESSKTNSSSELGNAKNGGGAIANFSTNLGKDNQNDSAAILKLAGCNIYGRMYRVGRIISELSGPCLECKCTETGVQCRHLKC